MPNTSLNLEIVPRLAGSRFLSVTVTHVPSGRSIEICGADAETAVRAAILSLSDTLGECVECEGRKTAVDHGHRPRCSFHPKPLSSKGTLSRAEGWVTATPQDGSKRYEYEVCIGNAGMSIGGKSFTWDELYEAAMAERIDGE